MNYLIESCIERIEPVLLLKLRQPYAAVNTLDKDKFRLLACEKYDIVNQLVDSGIRHIHKKWGIPCLI